MNLGQMLIVVCAMTLLGLLSLRTNSTIIQANQTQNNSEFGVTAVSLATSIVEEAMGTMFDASIGDTASPQVDTSLSKLTAPASLGHSTGESFRASKPGTIDFNDFDDFHDLFLVYKSNHPHDTARTTGSDYEFIVPGIRSKYFVRVKVTYVNIANLNSTSTLRTWHKKMVVTVSTPYPKIGNAKQQLQDSLSRTMVFPAVMSYWN